MKTRVRLRTSGPWGRPTITDCIEHAIGRNVARGVVKILQAGDWDDPYVSRNLLRFADNKDRAAAVFKSLYGYGQRSAATSLQRYALYHERFEQLEEQKTRPKTVTATNRGDIAATLVHMYRGGPSEELAHAVGWARGYISTREKSARRIER